MSFFGGIVQRPVVMIRAAPRMPARFAQAAPQKPPVPPRTNQNSPAAGHMARRGCGTAGQEKRRGIRAVRGPARKAAFRQEAADAGAEAGALCPLAEEAPPVLCAPLCGAYTAAL